MAEPQSDAPSEEIRAALQGAIGVAATPVAAFTGWKIEEALYGFLQQNGAHPDSRLPIHLLRPCKFDDLQAAQQIVDGQAEPVL